MPSRRTLPAGILPFGRSEKPPFAILAPAGFLRRLDWHGQLRADAVIEDVDSSLLALVTRA